MRKLWNSHPNLLSWVLLAIGMVIIVVLSARNVGFLPGQWAAIIVATILLAGLCVWIVSWEDGAEGELAENSLTDGPSAGEELSSGKERDATPHRPARSRDV